MQFCAVTGRLICSVKRQICQCFHAQDEEGETGTNCDGPNICRGQHKTPKGQHQMGRVVFFCRKSLVTCRVLGCRVALVIISIVKKRRRRRTSGASTTWFLQTERTAALRRTHFVTLQLREPAAGKPSSTQMSPFLCQIYQPAMCAS